MMRLKRTKNMDIENLLINDEKREEIDNLIWSEKRKLLKSIKDAPLYIWNQLNQIAFTCLGILASTLIINCQIKLTVDNQTISGLIIASAALLGSFVVLASTLSIIPIQNAMNLLTPNLRNYLNQNRRIQAPFSLIAIFGVFLLVLAATADSVFNNKIKIALNILLVASSFDLIRMYRRGILFLMEPGNVLRLHYKDWLKYFQRVNEEAESIIKSRIEEPSEEKISYAKAQLFDQWSLEEEIKNYISEVSTVTINIIKRGDYIIAVESISSLIKAYLNYINLRDHTIVTGGNISHYGLSRSSSIGGSVVFLLENLKGINIQAVAINDENLSIAIVKAVKDLGIYLSRTTVLSENNTEECVPELSMVVAYLDECLKASLKLEMHDVGLEIGRAIENIALYSKKNIRNEAFYGGAITTLTSLCILFYVKKKPALADTVSANLITLAYKVILENHFQKRFIFKHVLQQFQYLLPMSMESGAGLDSTISIYKVTGAPSIPNLVETLFEKLAKSKKNELEEGDSLSFPELYLVIEEIYEHFRTIGEEVEFKSHMVLWHIIYFIKNTQKRLFNTWEIMNDDLSTREKIEELINRLIFLPGCFFNKKREPFLNNVVDSADYLAYIALISLDANLFSHAVNATNSLISIFKKTNCFVPNNYDKADVLVKLEIIRIYSEKCNKVKILTLIDKFFQNPYIDDIDWENVSSCLENRKGHLQEFLNSYNEHGNGDSSRSFLKYLLKQKQEE